MVQTVSASDTDHNSFISELNKSKSRRGIMQKLDLPLSRNTRQEFKNSKKPLEAVKSSLLWIIDSLLEHCTLKTESIRLGEIIVSQYYLSWSGIISYCYMMLVKVQPERNHAQLMTVCSQQDMYLQIKKNSVTCQQKGKKNARIAKSSWAILNEIESK